MPKDPELLGVMFWTGLQLPCIQFCMNILSASWNCACRHLATQHNGNPNGLHSNSGVVPHARSRVHVGQTLLTTKMLKCCMQGDVIRQLLGYGAKQRSGLRALQLVTVTTQPAPAHPLISSSPSSHLPSILFSSMHALLCVLVGLSRCVYSRACPLCACTAWSLWPGDLSDCKLRF